MARMFSADQIVSNIEEIQERYESALAIAQLLAAGEHSPPSAAAGWRLASSHLLHCEQIIQDHCGEMFESFRCPACAIIEHYLKQTQHA